MPASETYEAFMLDYAAGNLSPAMLVAANIHRLISSRGDEAAILWESVRAALTDADSTLDMSDIDRASEVAISSALDVIHLDYTELKWRRGISGVKYARPPSAAGQLMRLDPGQGVLSHGHSALEATVVLDGALDDGLGVYKQGDIVLAEPGIQHRPSAHGDKACICFVARSPTAFWRLT